MLNRLDLLTVFTNTAMFSSIQKNELKKRKTGSENTHGIRVSGTSNICVLLFREKKPKDIQKKQEKN